MESRAHSKDNALLHRLGGFSKNIVGNHHLENLSEFVLHDLCAGDVFNISKAAYLVNNPDFECMKGVVGYAQNESFKGQAWDMPKDFTAHMQQSDFNQKVRLIYDKALKNDASGLEKRRVQELADQLEIENPLFHVWTMKHDNQGLLIFERPNYIDDSHEHMVNFMPMLSFCAIF
jgi:hypothetical protein